MITETLKRKLQDLAVDWPVYADQLVSYRLSPFLDVDIECRVCGRASVFLRASRTELKISDNISGNPSATVDMTEGDWNDVLSGRVGIMSVIFAGRCAYPKHQRHIISKMSIILQSLVTMKRV